MNQQPVRETKDGGPWTDEGKMCLAGRPALLLRVPLTMSFGAWLSKQAGGFRIRPDNLFHGRPLFRLFFQARQDGD